MARIFYKDLKKNILSNNLSKVYFFYGEEKYLIKQNEKLITSKICGDENNRFNFTEMNGEQIDINDVDVYINTYPVSSQNKCLVIRNLDIECMPPERIEDFVNIIKDVPEFSTLVMSQNSLSINSKSAKWKKFISDISEVACVVEFSSRDSIKIEEQLIVWAKENGKGMSFRNAQMIIKYCGKNLNTLKNEIDKLCAFEISDDISEKSIRNIVTESMDSSVFSMFDSLWSGNYPDMYKKLDKLFDNNESPILILSAIVSIYVDMFRVKAALNAGNSSSIISQYFDYKDKDFKINNACKNVYEIDMNQIKLSMKKLIYADEYLKTCSISPRIIIDILLVNLIKIKEGKY